MRVRALDEQSSYYFVSAERQPVSLELPSRALGLVVSGMNDQGFAVGGCFTGDPDHAKLVPCYWDFKGNPHLMSVPLDVTFGYATAINDRGSAVGVLGNEITQYPAMWNTLAATPSNLNAMLPSNSGIDLWYPLSLGNDFSIAGEAVSKQNGSSLMLGFQPL
jgi:hypothetical protein